MSKISTSRSPVWEKKYIAPYSYKELTKAEFEEKTKEELESERKNEIVDTIDNFNLNMK